jgi:hypothetical protein
MIGINLNVVFSAFPLSLIPSPTGLIYEIRGEGRKNHHEQEWIIYRIIPDPSPLIP